MLNEQDFISCRPQLEKYSLLSKRAMFIDVTQMFDFGESFFFQSKEWPILEKESESVSIFFCLSEIRQDCRKIVVLRRTFAIMTNA